MECKINSYLLKPIKLLILCIPRSKSMAKLPMELLHLIKKSALSSSLLSRSDRSSPVFDNK